MILNYKYTKDMIIDLNLSFTDKNQVEIKVIEDIVKNGNTSLLIILNYFALLLHYILD